MFYDDDADLKLLDGKTVAIIGYGSQGHAHALNLKDSGVSVVVGLRSSSGSVAKAREHGLRVVDPADAASEGDVVMMLVPDELHRSVWESGVSDGIAPGNLLLFGHGFSIHYGEVVPPPEVDVGLVAPKGPGHLVRRQFVEGSGVPGLVAIQQDPSGNALALTLAYAKGIGNTRAGVIETTFKDETETDLFGEQSVLCGGVTELVRAGYETLVDAGYDPRLAYFECLHELKLIVDLMYEKGISGMRYSISNTAEYGDMTRGPRVIGQPTRDAMKKILARHPIRGLRARVDRGEPRRPGELQTDARGAGRAAGRGHRQRASLADGLDRHGVRGVASLRVRHSRPDGWQVACARYGMLHDASQAGSADRSAAPCRPIQVACSLRSRVQADPGRLLVPQPRAGRSRPPARSAARVGWRSGAGDYGVDSREFTLGRVVRARRCVSRVVNSSGMEAGTKGEENRMSRVHHS